MPGKIINIVIELDDGPYEFTCEVLNDEDEQLMVRPLSSVEGLEQRLPMQLDMHLDTQAQQLDAITKLEMQLWSQAYVSAFQIPDIAKREQAYIHVKAIADDAIKAFRQSFNIEVDILEDEEVSE